MVSVDVAGVHSRIMPRVPVLEIVQEFCTSPEFEEEFEGFAKEYSDIFEGALECKSDVGEHPLEYYDAYRAYITKFEGKISDFIVQVFALFYFILTNLLT